jgi:hypothetical protein
MNESDVVRRDGAPEVCFIICSNRRSGRDIVLPKVYDSVEQCHNGEAVCGPTRSIVHYLSSDTIFLCGENEGG